MDGNTERRSRFAFRAPGARGRWLVIGIILVAVLLGFIGLRFRRFFPRPAQPPSPPPLTQPVTQPATVSP